MSENHADYMQRWRKEQETALTDALVSAYNLIPGSTKNAWMLLLPRGYRRRLISALGVIELRKLSRENVSRGTSERAA